MPMPMPMPMPAFVEGMQLLRAGNPDIRLETVNVFTVDNSSVFSAVPEPLTPLISSEFRRRNGLSASTTPSSTN
jgi:hypothetical protein